MIRNLKEYRADQQNSWSPGRLRKPDICVFEIQNRLNRKPNILNLYVCVCVNLSISTLVYFTQDLNTN